MESNSSVVANSENTAVYFNNKVCIFVFLRITMVVANFESTAVYFFNNKVCRILNDCGTEL